MDKVWGANVSQVPPVIPADAPTGYPTDGSSTGGVSATVPKAFWYYMLSEEIANAIKGGGLNLDRNDLSQLNQSIDKRIQAAVETIETALGQITDRISQVETTPPGAVMPFATDKQPSRYWLYCDGRAVSRTTYSSLFAVIGTTYGAGNGSTTFNLPDYRGAFIRGLDSGRGLDGGRRLGTLQGDAIRNITGTFDANVNDGDSQKTGAFYNTHIYFSGSDGDKNGGVVGFDASRVVPTSNENRPVNEAVCFFIHI